MPPKAKFTKEEILRAAMDITERDGIDALTARALGERLGSSARPVFTVFTCMDDVISGVIAAANDVYTEYVKEGLKSEIAFKGVGEAYIKFASQHPKLFQLLFMKEQTDTPSIKYVLNTIERNYDEIVCSITSAYNVSNETALHLYRHMWIYSHGIATLLVTGVCKFSIEEISNMLTETFCALIKTLKHGGNL